LVRTSPPCVSALTGVPKAREFCLIELVKTAQTQPSKAGMNSCNNPAIRALEFLRKY
jgi:hypothetical protein